MSQDLELNVLSCIFKASQKEQLEFVTRFHHLEPFHNHLPEWVWIQRHITEHGSFPSRMAFSHTFPDTKLIDGHDGKDLKYWVGELIEREKWNATRDLILGAKKDLESDDPKAASNAMRGVWEKVQNTVEVWDGEEDLFLESGPAVWERYEEHKLYLQSTYLSVPWKGLSNLIPSFRKKQLATLIARTSIGKTWIALYLGLYWWRAGARVLIISKEMPAEELAQRLDCIRFEVDFDLYEKGQLTSQQEASFKAKIRSDKPPKDEFIISDEEDLTSERNTIGLLAKVQQHRPNVVIVDGADLLVQAEGKELVKAGVFVSRWMKRFAKSKDLFVLQTYQTNRGKAEKDGKMTGGGLSSIYFSDAVAQNSDFVLEVAGIREEAWREIIVAKGRNTALGNLFINFRMSPYPQFEECAPGFAPTQAAVAGQVSSSFQEDWS